MQRDIPYGTRRPGCVLALRLGNNSWKVHGELPARYDRNQGTRSCKVSFQSRLSLSEGRTRQTETNQSYPTGKVYHMIVNECLRLKHYHSRIYKLSRLSDIMDIMEAIKASITVRSVTMNSMSCCLQHKYGTVVPASVRTSGVLPT